MTEADHDLQCPVRQLTAGLGCMQDEMLAHRLGLVPLKVDPNLFEIKTGALRTTHSFYLKLMCCSCFPAVVPQHIQAYLFPYLQCLNTVLVGHACTSRIA